jgi:hypothetical protein
VVAVASGVVAGIVVRCQIRDAKGVHRLLAREVRGDVGVRVCGHSAEPRVVAECIRSDGGKSFHLLVGVKYKSNKIVVASWEICGVRLWIALMDVT